MHYWVMLTRRSLWISAILLSLSMLGFGWLNFISLTDNSKLTAPLPAPGHVTRLEVGTPSAAPYQLTVEVPGSEADEDAVLAGTHLSIGCDISVSTINGDRSSEMIRSSLSAYGVYGQRISVLYGSPRFTLPAKRYIFEVRNNGCRNGYIFPGGMASITYAGPIRVKMSYGLLVSDLPYALGLIGLGMLIFAAITNLRSDKRSTLPPA